jgi:phosphohistidine phosphatase
VEPRRRLILLRHAKSSWDDASLPDDARPLAPRGRRAVALLEQYLRMQDPDIELVLCSPAQRTRETWDGVRKGLRSAPEVRFVPEVYEATANDLLDIVHQVDDHHRSVLLIGHNPGMQDLAERLVGDGKHKALARLGRGFPTGALAMLSFDDVWTDLDRGGARLDSFVRPKDLTDT